MKHKKLKLSVVLLLGLGLTGLQAQEAIPASAGTATGSGGSSSYSIGQVFYSTNTGSTGSVSQGVEQPYEISVVTEVKEANSISLKFEVYPNPTIDILTLKIDDELQGNCIATLYDIDGKKLETIKIESSETDVKMNNLAPAIYFLKVSKNESEIKTFKIIKN